MQLGPDPRAAEIWAPVPADSLPDVAAMRVQELAKLMASTGYQKHPEPWRLAVDIEFGNMQMAAQPPMPSQAPAGDAGQLTPAQSADVTEKAKAEALSMGA